VKTLILALAVLASVQAHALYGIDEAIDDVLSDKLSYVGSFVPRYAEDGKMKMCVYRGRKTVVFMFYCTKKSVSAESLSIHNIDPRKGSVEVYAEVPEHVDVTKVKRDRYYDLNFRVSTGAPDSFNFNDSIAGFRAYDDVRSKNPGAACQSTRTFPKLCKPAFASELETWATPAERFWNKPGKNWYKLVKLMKKKVP
jgi:hypothetical protein